MRIARSKRSATRSTTVSVRCNSMVSAGCSPAKPQQRSDALHAERSGRRDAEFAAREIMDRGTFRYADRAAPYAALSALFAQT